MFNIIMIAFHRQIESNNLAFEHLVESVHKSHILEHTKSSIDFQALPNLSCIIIETNFKSTHTHTESSKRFEIHQAM